MMRHQKEVLMCALHSLHYQLQYHNMNQLTNLGRSEKTRGNLSLTRHDNAVLGQYPHASSCVIDRLDGILYLMQSSLGRKCCCGRIVTASHIILYIRR